MKIRQELGQEMDLLRRWVLASGRDVLATTRDSVVSIEGRVGAALFVALWVLGRWGAGPWQVWGQDLGGEILPVVRTWYAGYMVLFQACLLVAHICVGIVWGAIVKNAWGLAGSLWPKSAANRFQPWVVGFVTGWIILLMHGGLLMRDLARHPALYQETFLDRGGLFGWVQTMSVQTFTGMGGAAVFLCVSVLVAGAAVRSVQRLVTWFFEFSRPTRVAIGVLGGAIVFFAFGIRFVLWTQEERNEGPNLLFISADGLRSDVPGGSEEIEAEALSSVGRHASVNIQATPVSIDLTPSLATLFTGRSPLSHGIRHDFPSEQDAAGDLNSVPTFLKANGWKTRFLADGPGGFLDRMGREFDHASVASSDLLARLCRRQLERSPHMLPYLSGRVGRWIPLLRGSPFLADPALLAREAADALAPLSKERKFFLWVHFSCLNPRTAIVTPRGAARWAGEQSVFYRRLERGPGSPFPTAGERRFFQKVFAENRSAFNAAVKDLLRALERKRLLGNTALVLCSPRATLLSEKEEREARHLEGPAFNAVPFLAIPAAAGAGSRPYGGPGRMADVPSTAVQLLGLRPPPEWGGAALMNGFPEGEAGIIYSETPTLFEDKDSHTPEPSLVPFLEEDPDALGHLRVDPAWEDPVLLFRDRAIQLGEERLVYHPGANGVTFEYSNKNEVPALKKSPAVLRAEKNRLKELREIFYRTLAQESGWRPQNDYWIPEAFLREAPSEKKYGN